ncbi:MAG TPA: beta-propeller domain-containing protein [Acidimicrobiales bacterium]|nr:beta-propeller domain-containing protein [Acidimicrobiales bacterium]
MKTRRVLAMVLTMVVLTGACRRSEHDDRDVARPKAKDPSLTIDTALISSLTAFDACDDLLTYLRKEAAEIVGPYGFGGAMRGDVVALDSAVTTMAAAAPMAAAGRATAGSEEDASVAQPVAGTDFSATNVQEEGVDEPDLVKTDGKRLVTIAGGRLRIVDLTGGEPRLAASLRLDDSGYLQGDLLLHGDHVLVLRQAQPAYELAPSPVAGDGVAPGRPFRQPSGKLRTDVTVVDIADISAPKVIKVLSIDGSLVASRMVAGVARLVVRSGPPDLPFLFPSGSEESIAVATEANKKVVAESTLEQWLPSFAEDAGSRRRLADCRDVRRPKEFSGVGMLSVLTVDADDPRPGPAATVVGAGELVYASAANLYVTSTVWQADATERVATTTTDIHKFGIGDKVRTTYEASGRIKGRLLNAFSMSELDGNLRVASTDDATQESAVTVLHQNDGALEQIGAVGGLGKGERIYAVRFLGDRGYVVTFRQTDPLYVLDLADPAAPVVKGELKIPGYSAYLHPVGDHRLIGIGQEASDSGRVQGTQVSLFDVADPADPKRLANAVIPYGRSEAESDHHAFLWWARTGLVMVPVQSYQDGSSGAVGFTVAGDAITELGHIEPRDRQPARRSIVLGDRILLVSDSALEARELTTLAERSWLPLG